MSEENKSTSITQITVPLVLLSGLVGLLFAASLFGAKGFYEKERIEFQLKVIIPLENKINTIISRMDVFEKQSDRGTFGEYHYKFMLKYLKNNGEFPNYDILHDQVMKRKMQREGY